MSTKNRDVSLVAPVAQPDKRKRGRPKKLVLSDKLLQDFEMYGRLDCPRYEMAAVLGVTRETLNNFLKAHPEAVEAIERGRAQMSMSLRRKLISAANGNGASAVRAMIFIAQNRLGMSEKVSHDGLENASPVNIVLSNLPIEPDDSGQVPPLLTDGRSL